MLRNVLARRRRIGPIGDIFLYSEAVSKTPCLALWKSQKDVIIVGAGRDRALVQRVLQCLVSAESGYREISRGPRAYRIFARAQASERLQEDSVDERGF